jgi:hypothetical protein
MDEKRLSNKDKARKQKIRGTLVGLALSGGGIRSATTCLGILQALAQMQILKHVDYLCTVSGGGYIGGCLSALLSMRNSRQRSGLSPAWQFQAGERAQFNTHNHFPLSEASTTANITRPVPPGRSRRRLRLRAQRLQFLGALAAGTAAITASTQAWVQRLQFLEASMTATAAPASRPELSGKEQVKYLRTHGNFLIARRGIFGIEALRSVGTLFTGVLNNITLFLTVLLMIAGLYMISLTALAPKIYTTLTPAATHRLSPDREASKLTRTTHQESPVTTDALGWTMRETIETVKEPLTFLGCVREYAKILWDELFALVRYVWEYAKIVLWEKAFVLRFTWLGFTWLCYAVLAGIVAVLLMFIGVVKVAVVRQRRLQSQPVSKQTIRRAVTRVICKVLRLQSASEQTLFRVKEGQSEEDAFESSVRGFAACYVVVCTVAVAALFRIFMTDTISQHHQLAWLFLPLIFCVAGLAVSTGVYLLLGYGETIALRCQQPNFWIKSDSGIAIWCGELWTRTFRSVWGSVQAVWLYLALVCLIFAFLSAVVFALRDFGIWTSLGAAVAFVATRLLIRRTPLAAQKMRIPTGLRNFLLGIVVALLLVSTLTMFCVLFLSIDPLQGPSRTILLGISIVAGAVFFLMGYCVNANRIGLHYFYRDRLIETFLRTEVRDDGKRMQLVHNAMEIPLVDLHGVPDPKPSSGAPSPACWIWEGSRAPYHLISAAINMADRRDLTRKDRKSGYFLFSKLFCGSEETGFQRTDVYRGGETKLSRAITISGAAVSSAMGYHTFFAQAFATTLFNLRTGYWMENPRRSGAKRYIVFWPRYLWKEILSATSARGHMVNLSDGGHTGDNVGIYPLLQRRCKVIIACDAEQDAALSFGSFTEALRHAYIDMNIDVDIDLEMLRPDMTTGRSRRQCAIGRIRYPDRPDQKSWLIYLKTTLTGDEPDPVMNYKQDHPAFPHQSTGDQFFDDAQFESYRALGVYIAEHAFGGWEAPGHHASIQEHDERWLNLQLRHSAFSASGDNVFQKLNDSYNALESMFMREPALWNYYLQCYDLAAAPSVGHIDPAKLRQAFMMQVTLMEQVYFGLRMDRYANSPDVRGWMNLFRRWSFSPTFEREFKALSPLFSERVVEFYRCFIRHCPPIEEEPVAHPWDSGDLNKLKPGIFLDSGRVDARSRQRARYQR